MGQCCSNIKKIILPFPPRDIKYISGKEYRDMLNKIFKNAKWIETSDNDYFTYSKSDLERFLNFDFTDLNRYKRELFDCDDFAKVLLGRERCWIRQLRIASGSTFGIIHGDIRSYEEDTNPRYHAVNFVILKNDDKEELWLIEPQNDKLFKLTSNSDIWFVFS